MSHFIQFQKKEDIVFVTLNRPEKKNSLLPEMIHRLISIFQDIKSDSSLKAIVLKGEGDTFCSGADLQWLSHEKQFSIKEIDNLFTLLETIYSCPVPVINKVQGFVIGGGLGLVASCDFVIAEKQTQFLFSETYLGLVPSVISPFVLKKISLSWTKFFMLSSQAFSAEKAQQLSLVHFTGTQKECDSYIKSLLNRIKKLDTLAVSKTKHLLNHIHSLPFHQVKSQCIQLIHEMRQRPVVKQKIQALLKNSTSTQIGNNEESNS